MKKASGIFPGAFFTDHPEYKIIVILPLENNNF